ncbi:RAMP superfamily CRISPR-associated protein, partial [Schnuerera sp.]|uniref:RAMP superfamily CRISPR-associated protein n=1 Tax=Schnuerera sp. TaxID=2794844 RepID=UPI002B6F9C0B
MKIYAMAQDPIYIGTGGFTIGRVDNTIVRDPITNIPKIPGTSVAGTWRYYMALTIHSCFKEKYRLNRKSRKQVKIEELFNHNMKDWITDFEGNRYAAIKCAGQDDEPNIKREEAKEKGTG